MCLRRPVRILIILVLVFCFARQTKQCFTASESVSSHTNCAIIATTITQIQASFRSHIAMHITRTHTRTLMGYGCISLSFKSCPAVTIMQWQPFALACYNVNLSENSLTIIAKCSLTYLIFVLLAAHINTLTTYSIFNSPFIIITIVVLITVR